MNDEILLIDKPAGMSSFGVVARVRRKLSGKAGYVEVKGKDGVVREKRKKVKVGHTGTLDPFATGLLLILTGKETKRANEFLKLDKEYVATIRLGATSTTGDIEGEIKPFVSSDQSSRFSEPAASRPVVTGETCFNRSPLVAKSSEEKLSPFPDSAKDIPVITLGAEQLSKAWKAEKVDDKFVVTGPKIEKFARRTDLSNYASVNRLRDIMKKMGIRAELTSLGAQPESIISIAGKEFTLVEDY